LAVTLIAFMGLSTGGLAVRLTVFLPSNFT
jgi:hypothetical protein